MKKAIFLAFCVGTWIAAMSNYVAADTRATLTLRIAPLECVQDAVSNGVTTYTILSPVDCYNLLHLSQEGSVGGVPLTQHRQSIVPAIIWSGPTSVPLTRLAPHSVEHPSLLPQNLPQQTSRRSPGTGHNRGLVLALMLVALCSGLVIICWRRNKARR